MVLCLAAIAAGSAGAARSDEPKGVGRGPLSRAAKADDENPTPAAGRMFVVGRVLDPQEKPVPGAVVMVQARKLTPDRAPFLSRLKMIALADARADSSGRFRIDAPGRRRRDTRISAPSRRRPAMVLAGSRSTPTTISQPPRSHSEESR